MTEKNDTLAYRHGFTYAIPTKTDSLELRGEKWGINLFAPIAGYSIFHPVNEVFSVTRANELLRAKGVEFGLLERVDCKEKER